MPDQTLASPLLDVRDLTIEFTTGRRTTKVVDRVSFKLAAGERAAMVGESGSGKSVTALAILGLLPLETTLITGSIQLRGRELVGLSDQALRPIRGEDMALVFQDPLSALNPVYTVGRQVAEMFRRRRGLSKRESRELAIDAMQRARIPHPSARFNDYPHQFSGGMRQRALIAMALALEPALLIADEPTTALDVTVEAEIIELLRVLSDEEEMALLFISHDLGVVARAADHVIVLYAGQVVEQGRIRTVYDNPANPYTLGLLKSIPSATGRAENLAAIPGRPPDPAAWPGGCRFHPRCWRAEDICADESPALLQISDEARRSRCHFAEELASLST